MTDETHETIEELREENPHINGEKFLGLTKFQFVATGVVVAVVLVMLAVTMLGIGILANRGHVADLKRATVAAERAADEAKHNSEQSRKSLCDVRAFYQEEIDSTNEFLAQNPGAEPIPGVAREILLDGVRRQEGLVDSLRYVDCPENGDR